MIIRYARYKRLLLLLLVVILLTVIVANSRPFLRLLYPMPYEEEVVRYAKQFQLDPLLVTAVIRVESKFNPVAESAKGAVGLMQLMPDTAKWAAKQMEIEYTEEMLIDPEYNISIGCWYLALLKSQLNGNIIAAVAAYNAGKTPVAQWLEQGRWDGNLGDARSIPFVETQNYVKKVFKSYEIYRKVYQN